MEKPKFRWSMLHPRYWLLWMGVGLWWLIVQLPYPVLVWLARGLTPVLWRIAKSRRHIGEVNLKLCFPEKSDAEREALLKENFFSSAMALFETGMAWFWPERRLRRIFRVEGLEHLPTKPTQGTLLMAMHFTHLDLGGALLVQLRDVSAMYRPHNNPLYDFIQRRGRERHSPETLVIPRNDVKGMVRALRKGLSVWYAPDQDYGRKVSIFVPFFGVPAATITATSKIAALGKARVVPFIQRRLPGYRGYLVKVYPPLDHFPGESEVEDAQRINEFVEARVREQPDQYLWTHRRFKTRPPGEDGFY